MLICAKDGWVEDWSEGIPKKWNYKGCIKYQNVLIYCLLPEGKVLYAKPCFLETNWLFRITWRIFNFSKKIEIKFTETESESFDTFKACLVQAIENNDDLLNQFKGEETLTSSLNSANSYPELHRIYRKAGWS